MKWLISLIAIVLGIQSEASIAEGCDPEKNTSIETRLKTGISCFIAEDYDLAENQLIRTENEEAVGNQIKDTSSFLLGLINCGRGLALVGGNESRVKAELCSYRKKSYDFLLSADYANVDFSRFKAEEDLATIKKQYKQCGVFLGKDYDSLCNLEDKREPSAVVSDAIDTRLKFYFNSSASPFYSAFFEKQKISENFLSDAKSIISKLSVEQKRLSSDLHTIQQQYNSAEKKVTEEFNRYLEFNRQALLLVDAMTLLASSSIDTATTELINKSSDSIDSTISSIESKKTTIQNLQSQLDVREVKKKAAGLCRSYYCTNWGLFQVLEEIAPTEDICDYDYGGVGSNLVCTGKITTDLTVDQFCESIAADFPQLSSYWSKTKTSDSAAADRIISCQKINI
ncbi:hypothetical protein [Pseudobacteriovorax antillogorgiicola]|uniref:Uncharacterized protein n=1 Tax=Pseudobacteriovorax antillogorgiicola TaxID=1513793 RepID=A0A1Y6C9P0_9BACT|nr:hypothetical protein [Pseudobacteriovorax antillogorgiicola]TCS50782.1 hypothetical protein EDD56_112165 [Pseudobacteriovorax antillogorgiicola]SMF41452.1 hypothetical protein SAMN06296036_112164 [Pseudobacteriovorax antillogorgiicola]